MMCHRDSFNPFIVVVFIVVFIVMLRSLKQFIEDILIFGGGGL